MRSRLDALFVDGRGTGGRVIIELPPLSSVADERAREAHRRLSPADRL